MKQLRETVKIFEYEISKISQKDFDMMKANTKQEIVILALDAGLMSHEEFWRLTKQNFLRLTTFQSIIFELRIQALEYHKTAVSYLQRFELDIISSIHPTDGYKSQKNAKGPIYRGKGSELNIVTKGVFEVVFKKTFSENFNNCMNLVKTGLQMARVINMQSILFGEKSPFRRLPLELQERLLQHGGYAKPT